MIKGLCPNKVTNWSDSAAAAAAAAAASICWAKIQIDTVRDGEGETSWESSIEMYT